jgi:hypothetical protein
VTQALSNPCLIPFLIGVTGHRDLRPQDISALEAAVQSVIEGFRERLPSTPVILLSALAAGADQLVARVALRCGADLAAVLPMPDELYRTTMDANEWEHFEELLPQASLVIRLPLVLGVTETRLAESEEARAEQYEALAVFLATYSQVVIALWDGTTSDAKGGTCRVIRYVLGNSPESAESWGEPQSGVVYRIVTPRESSAIVGKAFELETLTSLEPNGSAGEKEEDGKGYQALELSLETFNRDAMGKEFGAASALDGLVAAHCKASPASFACRVGKCYWAADDLSIHFSSQTRSTLLWILGFALAAVAGFEVYAHVFSTHYAFWLVYPGALVGAWIVHRFTKHRRIETRYLDYRALAEALRVQFFWNLAGIQESVADHYLVHHRTPLDWIRYALRGIWLFQLLEATGTAGGEKEIRLILEHWVQDQKGYYAKTSRKQKAALDRLERLSGGSLRGVWLLSLLIPASLLIPWEGLAEWRAFAAGEPWRGLLILLTTLPSITIGLVRVWMEQGAYEEQVRTYNRMAHVFGRAGKRIEADLAKKDPKTVETRINNARDGIYHLGIQALEENGDWLLLHRERPLKVVG